MAHSITFLGRSGTRYPFQVWPIATSFQPLGGVYIVTQRAFEDPTFPTRASHYPLAIGATSDLSEGLFTPARLKALRAKGADCICVCAVGDEDRRNWIAQDVIDGNERAGGQLLRYLVDPAGPPQRPAASPAS